MLRRKLREQHEQPVEVLGLVVDQERLGIGADPLGVRLHEHLAAHLTNVRDRAGEPNGYTPAHTKRERERDRCSSEIRRQGEVLVHTLQPHIHNTQTTTLATLETNRLQYQQRHVHSMHDSLTPPLLLHAQLLHFFQVLRDAQLRDQLFAQRAVILERVLQERTHNVARMSEC